MANTNRTEITRPTTRDAETQSLRAREPGKLLERAEGWKPSIAGPNLDKSEGIGRAVVHTNGQIRETLGWPMGY